MKQQITWEPPTVDSANGYGIKIHYLFTSFDKQEIDELKEWCEKHIDAGLVFEPVHLKDNY